MDKHRDERMPMRILPSRRQTNEELPPDLADVARRIASQPIPQPTAQETTLLVERLLVAAGAAAADTPTSSVAWSPWPLLRVAYWRARLLGPWFWIASVALITFGASVSLVNATGGNALALLLILPLTGVLSLAYALRTTSAGLREVEAVSPMGLVEAAAGLALAILGFDCAFGMLVTLVLALLRWAPFLALLAAWLGPLLLLTGVSLPLALRWGMSAAVTIGAGPWLALALGALVWPRGFAAQLFTVPAGNLSLALHLAAAAVGGCLLLVLLLRGAAWQRFLLAITAPLSI